MKVIEKMALIIFSNVILILSLLLCLIVFGWLDLTTVTQMIYYAVNDDTVSKIILGVCFVFILLAIKCIFFDSNPNKDEKGKDGILLENDSGKLMVSKDTLENLANSVVKGFENTENITSKVLLDKENNATVFINLSVKPGTVIKDLSNNLQTRVKETIKASLDLDVKEVNVTVKNIAPKVNEPKGGTINE